MTENENLAWKLYQSRGGSASCWASLPEMERDSLLLEVVMGHLARAGVGNARFDHNGRPILVSWESTPALYSAIFEQEYDGAPDSHHPVGIGRNMAGAVANLIEQDDVRRSDSRTHGTRR